MRSMKFPFPYCRGTVLLLFILFGAGQGWAAEKQVGVLISREIVPYIAMVEGFESQINAPVQRFFLDPQGKPYSLSGGETTLSAERYGALVAVGPEALQRLITDRDSAIPLAYGMVLNPNLILKDLQNPPCGVSLNMSAEGQFSSILGNLPALKRLGVLFDPQNNQSWFTTASAIAAAKKIELVPIQINWQVGRFEMVDDFSRLDAIMFIPDKSIISKAVIQYVIKQGVRSNTPVIGYNQFFAESGAALNFIIDYNGVGRQVAEQVALLLAGKSCEPNVSPKYEAVVNEEVWKSMGLPRE